MKKSSSVKKTSIVDPIISTYMRELGRKGGLKNVEKGPEYFKKISGLRKNIQKSDSKSIKE